jgi:HEAT repeat protein
MHTAKLKKFLRNINDEDASVRREAVEGLAEGDERAVYPLIKALRDDNFGVQDAAMRSLMSIKGESTAYMVLPLLRENSFLRNTALIILKEIGKTTIPLLYVLLNDRDDDVRKFALDLIHDIEYCTYPEKLVEMLTGDPNANVRAAASKTLGRLQYKKAIPQLIKALDDEEWVCFSALESLTELKDESSIEHIVQMLNSYSETTRFAAIEALGKFCSPKAAQPLIDHMAKADEFEKRAIIISLVQIGTIPPLDGISEVLIEMLTEEDWEDKLTAIKGLLLLNEEHATESLIDLAGSLDMSDPDNEDRLFFIKEAIQSFGCTQSLFELLNNDSVKYKGKVIAIEIIGNLRCEDAVPTLINLLKSEYRDIRRSSIKSLGEMDSREAKECLIDAISDEDSHVRKTAVIALGKISESRAFEPLMKMLLKEQYNDIIDEFVDALININSTLFLSRIGEFNDNVKQVAARHESGLNSGVTC